MGYDSLESLACLLAVDSAGLLSDAAKHHHQRLLDLLLEEDGAVTLDEF